MRGKTAVGLIFGLALAGALGLSIAVRMGATPLPILGQLVDFALIDQDDHPFGLEQLKGTATVVDFFFTQCQGPCPMMAIEMGKLQKRFAAEPKLRFVSISVDPRSDSTAALREYGVAVGAEAGKWLFLTGEGSMITELSEKGFMLPASTWPVGHSTKFTLVDKLGRIRGYYESSDDKAMRDLVKDIGRLFRSNEG